LAAIAGALISVALVPLAAAQGPEEPLPCPGCAKLKPSTRPWQIQLQGKVRDVPARFYSIDGLDNGASVVRRLKRSDPRRRIACYVNVGAWENFRPDKGDFPPEVLGARYEGYPEERWLDIRRIDVLGPILTRRFEICRRRGYDALDGDNVNGYQNRTGFPLTAADQLRFNVWFANTAHRIGMAAVLKNDSEQARDLVPYFDAVISEQCVEDRFCGQWAPFIRAGKAVFNVEYNRMPSRFCAESRRRRISSVYKRTSLFAFRRTCP